MDREKRETAFAEQYLKLRGPTIKCKDALEVVQNMGYTKTLRTMNRHIASVRSTGHALSVVKKVHRRSSLNDDQMSELNSWILGQNTKNIPVGYSDVQKCINDKFNIKVHLRTAGKILHRLGHTKKDMSEQNCWIYQNKRRIEDRIYALYYKNEEREQICSYSIRNSFN
jgi:transposase